MRKLTENQKTWLAALRSGEYKQGTNYLHLVDGRMCCLGVAAHIFKPDNFPVTRGQGMHSDCYFYGDDHSTAPDYVMRALGLRHCAGKADDESCLSSLAAMNDGGASFAEIADMFEKNFEAYTVDQSPKQGTDDVADAVPGLS